MEKPKKIIQFQYVKDQQARDQNDIYKDQLYVLDVEGNIFMMNPERPDEEWITIYQK